MSEMKKAVKKWAKEIGPREAVGRLVSHGVSPRAAEQLCAGDYGSEPKSLRRVLIEILAKDGIVLNGKAS